MKNVFYFLAVMATVVAIGFTSCTKDDPFVDINNPQDVQNNLRFDNAQRIKGFLPSPSSGNNKLASSISSVGVNSGNAVILPLLYSGASNVSKVFLQVVGAEDHISVKPTVAANGSTGQKGSEYISIGIPKNIDDGSFDIQYMIEDATGSNSNVVKTRINVTNTVVSCTNAFASGTDGLTFTTVDLGNKSGDVSIWYDTWTLPDRIDIYQGTTWIAGTGSNPNSLIPPLCDCNSPLPGFVGKSDYLNFNFNASQGRTVTVVVSGCLGSGTFWEWELVQSPNCN